MRYVFYEACGWNVTLPLSHHTDWFPDDIRRSCITFAQKLRPSVEVITYVRVGRLRGLSLLMHLPAALITTSIHARGMNYSVLYLKIYNKGKFRGFFSRRTRLYHTVGSREVPLHLTRLTLLILIPK